MSRQKHAVRQCPLVACPSRAIRERLPWAKSMSPNERPHTRERLDRLEAGVLTFAAREVSA
jgi:hypothetical protein